MRPGNAEWQRDVALSYGRVAVIEALQVELPLRNRHLDFLICRGCGVFIAAVSEMAAGPRAVVK